MVSIYYSQSMADFFIKWLAHPMSTTYFAPELNSDVGGHYLGYLGALIAFVLPTMGSLSAANYALQEIQ